MKRSTIDACREVRLWIGQIGIPAIMASIAIASNPYARDWLADKKERAQYHLKKAFNR